jgi:hypothetical protein
LVCDFNFPPNGHIRQVAVWIRLRCPYLSSLPSWNCVLIQGDCLIKVAKWERFTLFHYQYIHLQAALYVSHWNLNLSYTKVNQSNFSVDNLPVVKIDLRRLSNRRKQYVPDVDSNASINRFNNFARVYEVLLVGYVPRTHVQLMKESDFDCEELPE